MREGERRDGGLKKQIAVQNKYLLIKLLSLSAGNTGTIGLNRKGGIEWKLHKQMALLGKPVSSPGLSRDTILFWWS